MITRRKFVQLSTAALPMLAHPLWAKKHLPLGLQLYTLRDLYPNNIPGVLKQVRAIGYDEVELPSDMAGDIPAKRMREILAESGLTARSGHFEYATMSAKFDQAKELGLDWVVVPVIPPSHWTSLDGYRQAARQFNEWGKRARDLGMRFAFHNHDYEFRPLEGSTGYDVILQETDPELVFLEMDCYWIAQSGQDPVQMLKRLGKRVRLLHLKDRKPGFPPTNSMGPESAHFTEVGSGTLDWPAILALAQKLDVAHYYVEQDHTDGPAMESVRKSYNYLRTIVS